MLMACSHIIAVFNHEEPGEFDKVYRLTISD
jgi:hypothetical protein